MALQLALKRQVQPTLQPAQQQALKPAAKQARNDIVYPRGRNIAATGEQSCYQDRVGWFAQPFQDSRQRERRTFPCPARLGRLREPEVEAAPHSAATSLL